MKEETKQEAKIEEIINANNRNKLFLMKCKKKYNKTKKKFRIIVIQVQK